jgi:hypothetical protein
VTVTYKGRARLLEVDEAGHRVVMSGEGTEQGGGGSAKMTMESFVEPSGDGASRVIVKAKVDLVGRIVQFGRGMIKGVAQQLFKQFAAAVREELEHEEPAPAPAPEAAAAASPPVGEPPRALDKATVPATPVAMTASRPPRQREPVKALPLVFRALWDMIAGFFRRLFGRANPRGDR